MVLPAACDWKVKLPEMVDNKERHFYLMEMPHIKDSERGGKRWLEEISCLKNYLEKYTGKRFKRKDFLRSIEKYMIAWREFGWVLEMRRKGLISGTWSLVLTNAFMLDDVESWTKNLKKLRKNYDLPPQNERPKIFLAGSPFCFPNLKISEIIEQTGMFMVGDSLCTSEMLFGSVIYNDVSEYGLLRAVAERYQFLCKCPVFVRDERKIMNILHIMKEYNVKGLIYHLLKGCHPFSVEALYFEKLVKESGLRFLKIETDYSQQDKENILIRLEAFKETLY